MKGLLRFDTGVTGGEKHGNQTVNSIFFNLSPILAPFQSLHLRTIFIAPKKEGREILVYSLLLSSTKATRPMTIAAITAIAIATSVLINTSSDGSGSGSGSTCPPVAGAGPTVTHVVAEELP